MQLTDRHLSENELSRILRSVNIFRWLFLFRAILFAPGGLIFGPEPCWYYKLPPETKSLSQAGSQLSTGNTKKQAATPEGLPPLMTRLIYSNVKVSGLVSVKIRDFYRQLVNPIHMSG